MKEINLPSGDYIFVEILNDATDFYIDIHDNKKSKDTVLWYSMPDLQQDEYIDLAIGKVLNLKIISTTNDITEEECKNLIEYRVDKERFKDYEYYNKDKYSIGILSQWDIKTAKESLQSLIQTNNLNIEHNYLILLKTK